MHGRGLIKLTPTALAIFFGIFLFLISEAKAATITFQPDFQGKDAYVVTGDSGDPGCENKNYGSSTDLYVGAGAMPTWMSYIQFDLSSIPSGAVIDSANLSLYIYNYSPFSGPSVVGIHKSESNWAENTITWNNKPGTGLAYATQPIDGIGWKSFSITSLAQEWYGGSNFGASIERESGPAEGPVIAYSSDSGNATLRPKLEITYTESGGEDSEDNGESEGSQSFDNGSAPQDKKGTKETIIKDVGEEAETFSKNIEREKQRILEKETLRGMLETIALDLSQKKYPLYVIAVAAALSAISALVAFFSAIAVQSSAQGYSLAFINFLLSFFASRKKEKSGQVYDQTTKEPIHGALVHLYDIRTMKLIDSNLTDRKGRYYFAVDPGTYAMSVIKRGYVFPSNVAKRTSRATNIYFGDEIKIINKAKVINQLIPIDPTPKAKSQKSIFRLIFTSVAVRFTVLWGGTSMTLFVLYYDPNVTNYSIAGGYLILWLLELLIQQKEIKFSRVFDQQTKKLIDLAKARVITYDGRIRRIYITDYYGRIIPYIYDRSDVLEINQKGYHKFIFKPKRIGFVEARKFYLKPK